MKQIYTTMHKYAATLARLDILWIVAVIITIPNVVLHCQEELVVSGGLTVVDGQETPVAPGTLRWSGSDFEGWNGERWVSLTGYATLGTVEDIDGNVYKTARIGNQEWMVENLRTAHFRSGTPIIHQVSNWEFANFPAYCWYENDSTANNIPYGKLYNFHTVLVGNENVCPEGWHVPTLADWENLLDDYLGGYRSGGRMKDTGTDYWDAPNIGATNESGFKGRPGGYRHQLFESEGEIAGFWILGIDPQLVFLLHDYDGAYIIDDNILPGLNESYGFSIRCIKDN